MTLLVFTWLGAVNNRSNTCFVTKPEEAPRDSLAFTGF